MKQFFWIALLLLILMVSGAVAESSVRYEGGAEEFVFLPGSTESDTDLFTSFKNVLPGDVLTQHITVENTSGKSIRLYLRADPVDESHRDFLSQLQLSVFCRDNSIFEAAASDPAQLWRNVSLGTFRTSGKTELVVTLTVPVELDNNYMGAMGIIPWVFTADEIPTDDTPHTGDWFQLSTWMLLGAVLLVVILALIIVYKRCRA